MQGSVGQWCACESAPPPWSGRRGVVHRSAGTQRAGPPPGRSPWLRPACHGMDAVTTDRTVIVHPKQGHRETHKGDVDAWPVCQDQLVSPGTPGNPRDPEDTPYTPMGVTSYRETAYSPARVICNPAALHDGGWTLSPPLPIPECHTSKKTPQRHMLAAPLSFPECPVTQPGCRPPDRAFRGPPRRR